jgi:hypothetical protein
MQTSTAWRWTTWVGALYALVGAGFVGASFSTSALSTLNAILVPDLTPPTQSVRMYAAVMGAVIVGLGVLLARVARSVERGPAAIARALRDGLLAWFVVDTVASLLHGSWQNALFNVLSLSAGLPPLVLAARGATVSPPRRT